MTNDTALLQATRSATAESIAGGAVVNQVWEKAMVMVCTVVERFDSRECTEYIYLEPPCSLVIYIYISLSLSLSLCVCILCVTDAVFKTRKKRKRREGSN